MSCAPDRTGRRLEGGAVLALVVGFVAVQTWLLPEPGVHDAADYFDAAVRFPDLPEPPRHPLELRIGLIAPASLLFRILGPCEASYHAIAYLSGIAFVAATWAFGRLAFGPVVAWCGAMVAALNPYVLRFSGQLLTDLPATACFTLSATLLLVLARRSSSRARLDARTLLLCALAGTLLGLSYLMRESMVLLFPVFLVLAVAERLPVRLFATIAVFAALVFLGELLFFALVHEDPGLRIKTVLAQARSTRGFLATPRAFGPDTAVLPGPGEGRGLLMKLLFFPLQVLHARPLRADTGALAQPVGVLFLVLAGLLAVVGVFSRHRRLLGLLFWFVCVWLGLTAVGLTHPIRLFLPLFPALGIGGLAALRRCAGVLARGGTGGSRSRVPDAVTIAVALVTTGLGVHSQVEEAGSAPRPGAELRAWLAENGSAWTSIHVDRRSGMLLPLWLHDFWGRPAWSGDTIVGESIGTGDPTALVLRDCRVASLFEAAPDHRRLRFADHRVAWRASDASLIAFEPASGPSQLLGTLDSGVDRPVWSPVRKPERAGPAVPPGVAGPSDQLRVSLEAGGSLVAGSRPVLAVCAEAQGSRAARPRLRMSGGSTVVIRCQLDVEGVAGPPVESTRPPARGEVLLEVVYDGGEGFRSDRALSGLTVLPGGSIVADFLSLVPGSRADSFELRLRLRLRGPVHGTVGSFEIHGRPGDVAR